MQRLMSLALQPRAKASLAMVTAVSQGGVAPPVSAAAAAYAAAPGSILRVT